MKHIIEVITNHCMELMEENEVYRERILELENKVIDSDLQAEANKCHQEMLSSANAKIEDLTRQVRLFYSRGQKAEFAQANSKLDLDTAIDEIKDLRQTIKNFKSNDKAMREHIQNLKVENEALKTENAQLKPNLWYSDENLVTAVPAGVKIALQESSPSYGIEPIEYVYHDFSTKYDPFN